MRLSEALAGVRGYNHLAGKAQAAQQHLWSVARERADGVPFGLRLRVSGSGQSLPLVPWIALLDEDVTKTATDGLYLVYLFDKSVQSVSLSMNQGATQHLRVAESRGLRGAAAERAALEEIRRETLLIRQAVSLADVDNPAWTIELGSPRYLPAAYEAGNVVALTYDLAALPSDRRLAGDLQMMTEIYARCVEAKDHLAADKAVVTTAGPGRPGIRPAALPVFRPKDASDYIAHVSAASLRKSRRHEALVREFGETVMAAGHEPITNVHPRDLVVRSPGREWLVEAKTVGRNAEDCVREAIGQLYAYRHFYYRLAGREDPDLLALFSAPVGGALQGLLTSLGIEYVAHDGGQWEGSPRGIALTAIEGELIQLA